MFSLTVYLQICGQQMHDSVQDTRKRLFPVFIICSVYFFPPEFYSQVATKARQICRIWLPAKIDHWAE